MGNYTVHASFRLYGGNPINNSKTKIRLEASLNWAYRSAADVREDAPVQNKKLIKQMNQRLQTSNEKQRILDLRRPRHVPFLLHGGNP